MTTDFFCEREVKKTRKDHICECCGKKIFKGSSCTYVSGVWDSDFGYYHTHTACLDLYQKVRKNHENAEYLYIQMYQWEDEDIQLAQEIDPYTANLIWPHKAVGIDEDSICNRLGCEGIIQLKPDENKGCCSCHINPPCAYCTSTQPECPECGWRMEK